MKCNWCNAEMTTDAYCWNSACSMYRPVRPIIAQPAKKTETVEVERTRHEQNARALQLLVNETNAEACLADPGSGAFEQAALLHAQTERRAFAATLEETT